MSTIVRNVQLGSPAALPSKTRLSLAEGIPFNEWRAIGEQLEKITESSLWWVADWAAYGERWYRRDYGPALEQLWARKSLQNLASVARAVEPSRRREGLSFKHHALVTALSPDEQDDWLDDAERQGWTTRELQEELWRARGSERALPAGSPRIVLDRPDRPQWRAAAERSDMTLEEWATDVLDREAASALESAA